MIIVDDLHLDRPAQRYAAEILTDAARRHLGTYTAGIFRAVPGREQRAADYIEAAALRLPDVLAEHLEQLRGRA